MTDALHDAPWLLPLARVFHRAGGELYLVGGAVRNPLMGLPISDVDVCGPLLPEAVCALCKGDAPSAGWGRSAGVSPSTDSSPSTAGDPSAGCIVTARLRAAHFGTVELHLTDASGARHMAEYTTFREDSYRCGHKPDQVRFTADIAVDALRRDFSVNALYRRITPEGLEPVIDPIGGLEHLKAGVLHTVTPDPDQVLKDDGLRVLRAARFQAELDLLPTGTLLQSLTRHAPLLGDIARERLRDELCKVLLSDLRYPMLKRRRPAAESGLNTLLTIGAWPLLLEGLQPNAAAIQALKRLPAASSIAPLPLRMALLSHEAPPAQLAALMASLRFARKEAQQAALWVQTFQQASQWTAEPQAALALMTGASDGANAAAAVKAGMEALSAAEAMLRALGKGQSAEALAAFKERLLLRRAPLSLRELTVSGSDLLPLCRGQSAACLGGVLNTLWESVLREELPNEKNALLAMAEKLIHPNGCVSPTAKNPEKPTPHCIPD